jgi:hypothetical protein
VLASVVKPVLSKEPHWYLVYLEVVAAGEKDERHMAYTVHESMLCGKVQNGVPKLKEYTLTSR